MTLATVGPALAPPVRRRRRRRLVAGCAVAAAGVAGVGLAAAPSNASPTAAAPARPAAVLSRDDTATARALALLGRAALAARTTPYTGVQLVTAWDGDGTTSVVADVAHVPGFGAVVHVRATAGGGGARVLDPDDARSGDLVPPNERELRLLGQQYVLGVDGSEVVDGRPCDIVAVRRSDGSLAARFWIDRASGLVLRRELLDAEGRMLRSSVFVNLAMRPDPGAVAQSTVAIPQPWTSRVDPASAVVSLPAKGYHVPSQLPGGFVLYDARLGTTSAGPVLHLSYSDGLTVLSVFQQRGRLDVARLDGWRRERAGGATVWAHGGMPAQLTWAGRGTVYTVLSDAPRGVVDRVVAAFPHGYAHRGLAARIGHGLARIGSWLNPFG